MLGITKDKESKEFENFLENLNLFFFGFFIFELIAKLLGTGLKQFFLDKFNWFDSSVVIVSAVDVILQNVVPTSDDAGKPSIFNLYFYRWIT